MITYDQLQIREIFHLEFLRRLAREVKPGCYALKGGTNLRFFFRSIRYSEDMDLDATGISKHALSDSVMKILKAPSFHTTLKTFGVERIVPPDMTKAKQTETTQRFKVHLLTLAGEDLYTKIEFSRRGVKGRILNEAVPDHVLRAYKMAPLIVPHYGADAAVQQKIGALAGRAVTQARDIFDIFFLLPQYERSAGLPGITTTQLKRSYERIFEIDFEEFRDTVAAYLSEDDRRAYGTSAAWDEIKLKTAGFLEEALKGG